MRPAFFPEGLFRQLLAACTAAAMLTAVSPVALAQESARDILEKVEDALRSTSDSAFNRIQLSSCQFGIRDNQITCAERARIKALESVGVNFGADNKDDQVSGHRAGACSRARHRHC